MGGLYRTAARLQGAAAIAVPPADPALQLTAERRDGATAVVAVLRAAATGPFCADARLSVAGAAEQVCRSGRLSLARRACTRMRQRSAAAQVAVRVSANVMPASKGTPALRPDVFVVAEQGGGAADTDLDA